MAVRLDSMNALRARLTRAETALSAAGWTDDYGRGPWKPPSTDSLQRRLAELTREREAAFAAGWCRARRHAAEIVDEIRLSDVDAAYQEWLSSNRSR